VYFNSFLAYTKFLLRYNVPTSTLGMETLHFPCTKYFYKLSSFEARSSYFPSTNVQSLKQTWCTKPCSFNIDFSQSKWTIQTSWKFWKQLYVNFLFVGLKTCLGNKFSCASLDILTWNKLGGVEDGPTSLWRCDDIKTMKLKVIWNLQHGSHVQNQL